MKIVSDLTLRTPEQITDGVRHFRLNQRVQIDSAHSTATGKKAAKNSLPQSQLLCPPA